MQLTYSDIDAHVRRIDLTGRLDLEGTGGVDLRFTALAASGRRSVIVDLSQVEFIASIALGMLVRVAKAVKLRGGTLVLLNPTTAVERVLQVSRLDQVLPVCHDLKQAVAMATATSPLA